jgi:hypothetical protein
MKFTQGIRLFYWQAALFLTGGAQASGQMAVHEVVPTAKIVRYSPALDAVIAPDVKIEKVATGFVWTEGPMWHKGALWFSDLSGNKMYSLTPDGKLKVLLDKAGGLQSFPAGGYGGSNAMVANKGGSGADDAARHAAHRTAGRQDEREGVPGQVSGPAV